MKIISTMENYLVAGFWLPLHTEVDIAEEDVDKYLYLPGVKVVEEIKAEVEKVEEKAEEIITAMETPFESRAN